MYGAPKFTKAYTEVYSDSDSDDDAEAIKDNNGNKPQPRKRRRVNKDRAALGIFGDESDEDNRSTQRWKQKTLRTQGLSFVSSGQHADDTFTKLDQDHKVKSDESAIDIDTAGGFAQRDLDVCDGDDTMSDPHGLQPSEQSNFLRAGVLFAEPSIDSIDKDDLAGLETPSFTPSSFKTAPYTKSTMPSQITHESRSGTFKSDMPFGKGFVPSSAYAPVLRDNPLEDKPDIPRAPKSSAFTAGQKSKLGNSFAQRMMSKMGYVEGQGLGKESQGRNIIIEANLRPQGVGLGAVREKSEQERKEERRQAKLRGEKVDYDSEEDQKLRTTKKKKTLQSGGSSSGTSTPRNKPSRPRFVTADELKKMAPGLHVPTAFAPILDMTGPGEKTLTSAAGLMSSTFLPTSEPPEVTRRLELIKRAHVDLAVFSEEWHTLVDRTAWLEKQLAELEQNMGDLTTSIQRLTDLTNVVEGELPVAVNWEETISCLKKAVTLGATADQASDMITAAIHPLIKASHWNPLSDPTRFSSDLQAFATILLKKAAPKNKATDQSCSGLDGSEIYRNHHKTSNTYESLMYKLWLPKVLGAVRMWDVYNPAPILSLMEAWTPILPPFIHHQLMNEIVRRLDSALSEWSPRKQYNSLPPHTWLFPWLPLLPSHHLDPRGSGLVTDVKRKFRGLISSWDFGKGPVPGLVAWRAVLGKEWAPLLIGHVLPCMGRFLRRHFRVDPSDQAPYVAILQGVLQWKDVLGTKTLGEVVSTQVFPMWHDKLNEWFSLQEVNFSEVADWFEWWNNDVYPPDIQSLSSVREEFEKGLARMERALESLA
ncbi:uncharacterized protein BROUX77_004182 [Berkeleyomyces rouxiae]|uniref:uncharacterized protein n=1 Tax=Berkeleyomyces rouxiae TaxID=2035830 RepID=UPI003B7C4C71